MHLTEKCFDLKIEVIISMLIKLKLFNVGKSNMKVNGKNVSIKNQLP